MRNAIIRRMHVWSPESDERLLNAVRIYGTENWSIGKPHLKSPYCVLIIGALQVARMVSEDVTANQCQGRYSRTLDPDLRRGPWSGDEDARLRRAVEVYGHQWTEISLFVPNRSSDQCRDRWQEGLCPTVSRVKWVEAEDKALLGAIERIGEGRWKEISQMVGNGRTDSMVCAINGR